MNKAEKQVARAVLDAEKKQLRELKAVFNQARKDTQEKIIQLSARIAVEPQNLQTIIYQIKYQQMIQQQLDNALHDLQQKTYDSVDQYLHECYNNGYVGTMYSISAQGIPLTVPIDQKRVADALKIDSKISEGLYTRMGEDVKRLKNSIRAEVSRGIANGESWYQLAQHIAKGMNSPFDAALSRTMTIARTEGHRVQENATMDAAKAARDKGANQLKQWDSALDERVRPAHREADGQLRELDEPFSVMGEQIQKPGEGSAANCINCRCHMLLRARWELDESELEILKERAKVHEVYGIKNQSYKEYKDKYLKLPANADKIPVDKKLSPASIRKEIKQIQKDIDENWDEQTKVRQSLWKLEHNVLYKNGNPQADALHKTLDDLNAKRSELQKLRADKVRSLVTCMNTTFTVTDPSDDFISQIVGLEVSGIKYKEVMKHTSDISDIVSVLAGGDKTQGSCASLGLAYIGQKQGYDILDFRGGSSQDFFSTTVNLVQISKMPGIKTLTAEGKTPVTIGNNLLKMCQPGKEYYLCVGRHASIVRKTQEGKLQYLELQSASKSGWTDFNGNPRYTLAHRFGCASRSRVYSSDRDFMIDIDESDFSSAEFRTLLGYINTDADKQRKGSSGTIK